MIKRLLLASSLACSLSLCAIGAHGPVRVLAGTACGITGSLSHAYGYTDGRGNVQYDETAGGTNNAPVNVGIAIYWHDNTNGNSWNGSTTTANAYGGGFYMSDNQWLTLGHNYTVTLKGAGCVLDTDTYST